MFDLFPILNPTTGNALALAFGLWLFGCTHSGARLSFHALLVFLSKRFPSTTYYYFRIYVILYNGCTGVLRFPLASLTLVWSNSI